MDYRSLLFLNIYDDSMKFTVMSDPEKSKIKSLITKYGGEIVLRPSSNSIQLVSHLDSCYVNSKNYYYSSNFVCDCIREFSILDLNLYLVSKPLICVNALDVLLGLKTWVNVIAEAQELSAVPKVVESLYDSEDDEDDVIECLFENSIHNESCNVSNDNFTEIFSKNDFPQEELNSISLTDNSDRTPNDIFETESSDSSIKTKLNLTFYKSNDNISENFDRQRLLNKDTIENDNCLERSFAKCSSSKKCNKINFFESNKFKCTNIDKKIIECILNIPDEERHLCSIWDIMSETEICEGYSAAMLLERFRKHILPNLNAFQLSKIDCSRLHNVLRLSYKNLSFNSLSSSFSVNEINESEVLDCKKFRNFKDNTEEYQTHSGYRAAALGGPGFRKNAKFYTKNEDKAILNWLQEYKNYSGITGLKLWIKMADDLHIGRSAESLKNRFRHQLVMNLDTYGMDEDTKCLLHKACPQWFKKLRNKKKYLAVLSKNSKINKFQRLECEEIKQKTEIQLKRGQNSNEGLDWLEAPQA